MTWGGFMLITWSRVSAEVWCLISHKNWEMGVLSSWMSAFQRDAFKVLGRDIPGWKEAFRKDLHLHLKGTAKGFICFLIEKKKSIYSKRRELRGQKAERNVFNMLPIWRTLKLARSTAAAMASQKCGGEELPQFQGRGDGREELHHVQGQGLCWSCHEEIPHMQGKRNPSKTVGTERGH